MTTTTLPLEQDMYAVLCAVKKEFVGRPALRAELMRVINRAHEEALDRQEQVTAEHTRISPALRESIRLDSQAIDPTCGF